MADDLYTKLLELFRETNIYSAEQGRSLAKLRLPKIIFDFIEGSTGTESAPERNREGFKQINLRPRVLKNVSNRTLSTNFLSKEYGLPIGFSPMGMCGLSCVNADQHMAKSALEFNIPVVTSTAASISLEHMRDHAKTNSWFQLYSASTIEATLPLIERAKLAGYENLVLTVDVPQVSQRIRDLRNGFAMPFKIGPSQFLDFAFHPRWSVSMYINGAPSPENFRVDGVAKFDREASRSAADWAFLKQLRDIWKGRLIIKGVNDTEDALEIKNIGCDAVWVSNHGGRQLDSAPSSISRLPIMRKALGKEFPIIFDSGVRTGDDVVKALACGADLVMLGRPILFCLGAQGPKGLRSFLKSLELEISNIMAQIGIVSIAEIDKNCINFHGGNG
ncbi:MAG: alpha-hydroxy acid oxidase [Proteobacteria bacterium]|jgi:isopentenyl diphosphate isomerase/L-lactate dehydrogenase-like FMN-dependent dehydrogenase|nr:alpha-hydroxy acid oxidase [Pseudomonadota bacterium]